MKHRCLKSFYLACALYQRDEDEPSGISQKIVLPFGLRPKTLKFIGSLMDSRFRGFCGQQWPRSRNQLEPMQDSDGNAENVLISSKVGARTTPVSIFYPSPPNVLPAFALHCICRCIDNAPGGIQRSQTATCPEVEERGGEGRLS